MSILFIGVGDAGCKVAENLRKMQPEGMKFMKVCDREEWLEDHIPNSDCLTVSLLDPDIAGLPPGDQASFFERRAELHADEIKKKIQSSFGISEDNNNNTNQ